MSEKTQLERVIAAARGFRGVTQVDFLLPDVVDGGPPITRLAARLLEADEAGYSFECLGRRDRCKIFRLVSEPAGVERTADHPHPPAGPSSESSSSPQVDGALSTGRMFEVGKPTHSPYDPFSEAA